MEQLSNLSTLLVNQKKELVEVFTDFETSNKYQVMNEQGEFIYQANEVGGNWLTRTFLKALRPFTISLTDSSGAVQLRVNRPFRFYFHEIEVVDASGKILGTVKREFSILRRLYSVMDSSGKETFKLFGPLLKPWTFEIKTGERPVGKISKKWSGLLKESFTDADNFGVTFPEGWKNETKATILGAVFLIDFVHFENSGDEK